MSDIITTPDNNSNQPITDTTKPSIPNGTSSITSTTTTTTSTSLSSETTCTSPSNTSTSTKPTTMPASRKLRLQQMLWHSLMEAKGEIVGVTKTNGETYSGVLFAIEPNDLQINGTISDENSTGQAWKYIILKYVQKMNDPNMDPSTRTKSPFMEELKIPASDFAVLSAKGLTDHTNSYRRSDRQAFNDATGRKLHRKERELVRWDAGSQSIDASELENEDDLDELRNGSYDQFEANKKYNINATFDESVYTSHLDKSDPDYTKNLKDAKLDEQRIMNQPVTNKHVADDRAYFHKHNKRFHEVDKDQDEEDAYSRVLHPASMSKISLKNKNSKNNNSYVPPALRNNNNNNNNNHQNNNKKNKGHNKGRDRARPPINNNRDNNQNKNKGNNNRNDNNMSINSPNNNKGNNNQNQMGNNKGANQGQNNQQNNVMLAQALANNQILQQQAKLAQFNATNATANAAAASALGGGLFAGLPPHIAQIVQTVTPQQTISQIGGMNQQQLAALHQQMLQNNNQQIGRPLDDNSKDEGNINKDNENTNEEGQDINNMTTLKDDNNSLNPHAKAFTPQIAPNQKSNNNNNQQQNQQGRPAQLQTQTQQTNAMTPNTSAQQLLTQQGQQAILAQQQLIGQYNYNPATGQYVLNPFAQGQQNQLALLQHTQYQASLQQLALQQQIQLQQQQQQQQQQQNPNVQQIGNNLNTQQTDPTSQIGQQLLAHQQQQLLAHQQAQQAHLLAQQAQANGLNIGAPLFTPSNMPQQTQQPVSNVQQQANMLTNQNQFQQNTNLQQQQQAALLQQQYLQFGGIPQQQQQFYMGNANMQNLMQQ